MKRLFLSFALCSLLLLSPESVAGSYHTLYGFKIGQELELVKRPLGKPVKVFSFEDGWKAYVYQRDGHNIILEADNTRPDLIASIQIEGETNPPHMGLDGIDLGSDANKAMEQLGAPSERKPAENLTTKTAVPDTFINFYGNGFSFEEKEGKVTSIKVTFDGAKETTDRPDFDAFMLNVKAKNYYRIAESISSRMTLNGKSAIQGPIIEQISGQTGLNAFLFGKNGLESISPKDISDVNLRLWSEGREERSPVLTGFVYKFNGKAIHELFFVQSFEGWVLYDAW